MPDGMTFDIAANTGGKTDKVQVTSADPTILSLQDIMALDDDLDLGMDEEEADEANEKTESKVYTRTSFTLSLSAETFVVC